KAEGGADHRASLAVVRLVVRAAASRGSRPLDRMGRCRGAQTPSASACLRDQACPSNATDGADHAAATADLEQAKQRLSAVEGNDGSFKTELAMEVYADVRAAHKEIREYLCYYECDTRLHQSSGQGMRTPMSVYVGSHSRVRHR